MCIRGGGVVVSSVERWTQYISSSSHAGGEPVSAFFVAHAFLRCIMWPASATLSCDVTSCPSNLFLSLRRLKKAPIDDDDSCSRETLAARQACPSRSCAPRAEELEILMERRVVAQIARHKAQSKLVREPPKAC